MPGNPLGHFLIHPWHDVLAGIMQSVVKIKEPNRTLTAFKPRQRPTLENGH
jgi:hypothetical protein